LAKKDKPNEFRYDVLIISDDVVGSRMAGPGIRCWEMAKVMARHFKVGLAIPDFSYISPDDALFKDISFDIYRYSLAQPNNLKNVAASARIVIIQGYILSKFPFLRHLPVHLIVDVYVPFVLENIFTHRTTTDNIQERHAIHLHDLRVFNDQLQRGDHFLCATPRQRDLIFGALLALNRINPRVADQFPALDDLISIIPFGLEEAERPVRLSDQPLRRLFPEIGEGDIVILWGGVLTNWFDPLTLIQAFYEAIEAEPRLKLIFLSTTHPNPLLPKFAMAQKAINLAQELGLLNRSVFFNQTWIDYRERSAYFSAADIGISIHQKHLETEYSFRTRILDYIKHELPIICTEGDYFADFVAKEELGMVVPAGAMEKLREAILRLAKDKVLRERIKERMRKVKEKFGWSRVLQPLITHCEKVLEGKAMTWPVPSERELKYVCLPYREGWIKKMVKRIMGNKLFRLNWRLIARLRRLWP
jgi:glycosyltransferase involved in cell wall biosynthesis